jgi:GNAT superfamily N-acetyltransferase
MTMESKKEERLEIVDLHRKRELIEVVTKWTWREWGTADNYDFFKDLVQKSLNKDDIPQTFVALINNQPVGTVSLLKNDLKSRQDLSPWLASLYIAEEYRGRGIGRALQDFVMERAKSLGYRELYLFTRHSHYYKKNNWVFLEEGHSYAGYKVKIYRKSL